MSLNTDAEINRDANERVSDYGSEHHAKYHDCPACGGNEFELNGDRFDLKDFCRLGHGDTIIYIPMICKCGAEFDSYYRLDGWDNCVDKNGITIVNPNE